MNKSKCRLNTRIIEICEECTKLHCRQHSLVDERTAGKRREVHAPITEGTEFDFRALASEVHMPIKSEAMEAFTNDERLKEGRLHPLGL